MTNLQRVLPRPTLGGLENRAFGDQYKWGAGIPLLYRALASRGGAEAVLAAPTRASSDDSESQATTHACAYRAALLHLTTFSLGWTCPAQGLIAWTDVGRPDDDPRLELLAATYWEDRQLGALIEWLLASPSAAQGVWRRLAELRGWDCPPQHLDRGLLALGAFLTPKTTYQAHGPGEEATRSTSPDTFMTR